MGDCMRENEPLISVIVPVYKVEKYLDRCVTSLVNQTYKNLEIILVDDGSPDSCPQMCDAWAKKDDRIKVIHKENRGLSSARNEGLQLALGEYIGFVDSDDWVDVDTYEHLYTILIDNEADFSAIEMEITKKEKSFLNLRPLCVDILDKNELCNVFFRVTRKDIKYCVCDKLFKRSLIEDEKFIEGMRFEDINYCFRVFKKCSKAVFSNQKKYYWFVNNEGITNNKMVHADMQMLNVWQDILSWCEAEMPEYAYFAKMNYKRAHMALLGKYVKYGVHKGNLDWKNDRRTLLAELRKSFFALMKWELPISRKFLLIGLCISPEICALLFRMREIV